MAIRGKVKEFFSDRGTNFIGGAKELGIPAICVEDRTLKTFLNDQGTVNVSMLITIFENYEVTFLNVLLSLLPLSS
jgi:hypothetical protein